MVDCLILFFFKQKTAYDMRISDWSSDVCSSDLVWENPMLALLTYFFAGAFLVNGVPHFVQGVSGRGFPSPFANPPGQGESSAQTNVLWGAFNFVVGYALAWRVGHLDRQRVV